MSGGTRNHRLKRLPIHAFVTTTDGGTEMRERTGKEATYTVGILHKQATQARDWRNLLTAEEYYCKPLHIDERPVLRVADSLWVGHNSLHWSRVLRAQNVCIVLIRLTRNLERPTVKPTVEPMRMGTMRRISTGQDPRLRLNSPSFPKPFMSLAVFFNFVSKPRRPRCASGSARGMGV